MNRRHALSLQAHDAFEQPEVDSSPIAMRYGSIDATSTPAAATASPMSGSTLERSSAASVTARSRHLAKRPRPCRSRARLPPMKKDPTSMAAPTISCAQRNGALVASASSCGSANAATVSSAEARRVDEREQGERAEEGGTGEGDPAEEVELHRSSLPDDLGVRLRRAAELREEGAVRVIRQWWTYPIYGKLSHNMNDTCAELVS